MIGGALAEPVTNFPGTFAPGGLFDRFPYLLPNLFSALCVFVGLIVGILFLEETHAEKKRQRDRGLEIGSFILARIPWHGKDSNTKKPEKQPLLDTHLDEAADEALPGYRSTESSPRLLPTATRRDLEVSNQSLSANTDKKPAGKTFTRDVVLNIISYGILAL